MTPLEVRDRLEAIGFDLSKYSSSLAAIHTVLKRLQEARELRFVELDSGKFAYEWQQAPARGAHRAERIGAGRPPARRRSR